MSKIDEISDDKLSNVTVIIPTYNRTEEIIYNIKLLDKICKKIGVNIPLIIGDDGSREEHKKAIKECISKLDLDIIYYYNDINLGIERNELKLVSLVKTEYAMLLGEDDYLNAALITNILKYTKKGKVGVVIPNFYGVNKNGEQLRTARFKIKKDLMIAKGDVKYFCYASQMSGLTFKVDGICEEYHKRGIEDNSYPHLFFVGYNLEKHGGVFITKNPFRNTVLKKKQFDYSVDNLLSDVLKIAGVLKSKDDDRRGVIKFVLFNDVTRYGNQYTWIHPTKLFKKVKQYDSSIDKWTRKMIGFYFLISYFRAPYIVFNHFYVRRNYRKNKVL